MSPAFEKLNKILKLEQSQGYRNRSVIGGLENFAEIWRAEALAENQDENRVEAIGDIADLLKQYPATEQSQRAEAITGILDRLGVPSDAVSRQRATRQVKSSTARRPPLRKPSPPSTATGGAPERPGTPEQPSEPSPAPSDRPRTGLDAPVTTLPGISSAYAARLQRLDIATVGDLIYHFPHRYDDYRSLKPIGRLEYGEETTIIGVIWETSTRPTRSGGTIISSIVADGSGTIQAIWFNQPYMVRQLRAGRRIVLSGRVDHYQGRLTLKSPAWEPLESDLIHTARLVPIYPLTQGISARWMRRLMKRVVDHWAPRLEDYLPQPIRERTDLLDLPIAIQQIHFPEDQPAAEAARRRLSFDEFLMVQVGMLLQRQKWQNQQGTPLPRNQAPMDAFLDSLPFQLTEAQRRSLDQVQDDLTKSRPMSRLLQGDVGSGKTVVAAGAMLQALAAGKQAALMAPTEILAEQHYQTITSLLGQASDWGLGRPTSVVLLTGRLHRVERGKAYAAIASGQADIVVGTHSLIQRHVTFRDLALIVVDEQHRFGVVQRGTLRDKGTSPHVLVMSATPIPRSLALTVYGDLDISVIDEMPPGRQPIETRWLLPKERERAYAFLRKQVQEGRQAFILYPLIEESDKVEAKAAVEEHEKLQSVVFPDLQVGLLHGKMKARQKEEVMNRFRQGEIALLVSTSVIEVGIDVPNATVMLIEGADRFGLAQLHQFRGRVGRGAHRSYCLLLSDSASPDNPETRNTWERLKAIQETQDGFVLAEKDLELRGPGDFLGVRQSGLPTLRLASLSDVRTLEMARTEALALFEEDPSLHKQDHQLLREQVSRFWQGQGDLS
jgi:ATP-dependent DNA helicase RecG